MEKKNSIKIPSHNVSVFAANKKAVPRKGPKQGVQPNENAEPNKREEKKPRPFVFTERDRRIL